MLKELQFVRGSIGKSKVDLSLSHFNIKDGYIKGFNGVLSICTPIPFDVNCQPDAGQLIKAVGNCKAAVELSMTPAGKLRLKSGTFKAFINCYDDPMPDVEPEGEIVAVNGKNILDAMRRLIDFVGDDAARQWTNGIMFRGKVAMATNNVCLVQAWIGTTFPLEANVPAAAVRELIRIGDPPTHVSMTDTSMTFYFSDERWLRTQLYSTEWPDVDTMFGPSDRFAPKLVPDNFWDGIDALSPFQDKLNRVYFRDGEMLTSLEAEEGASFQVAGLPEAIFNINMLKLVRESATKFDFSLYPGPGYFTGDKIRGLIVGIRPT